MRAYIQIKPVTMSTRKETVGVNIAMMPLRRNVPAPRSEDWKLTNCPHCGRECWYQYENAEILKTVYPNTKFLCTECALIAGAVGIGK